MLDMTSTRMDGAATGEMALPRYPLVPVPMEHTTCYGHGTRRGPQAMLAAQLQIEEWDEECGDHYLAHLDYAEPIPCPDLERSLANIEEAAAALFADRAIVPVFLGGEHSITPPIIRGLARTLAPEERLGVIFFDAHGDLRDSYEGTPDSHACAARRVRELAIGPVQQIGLRSYSREEVLWARERGITLYPPCTPDTIGVDPRSLLAGATRWYVSIDLDALDPSECPAVGTPEPGGLRYRELLSWIDAVCRDVQVCGFDIVELAPRPELVYADAIAARVMLKCVNYHLRAYQGLAAARALAE
jgi:agmatinase